MVIPMLKEADEAAMAADSPSDNAPSRSTIETILTTVHLPSRGDRGSQGRRRNWI